MKHGFFAVSLGGCLALLPICAVAETKTYLCNFAAFGTKAEQSWIPTKALFLVDMQARTAETAMTFKDEIKQDPWPVSVGGVGTKKIVFSWLFKDLETRGASSDLSLNYTVRLNTVKNTVTIRAWPRGYDNDMRGKGNCKLLS